MKYILMMQFPLSLWKTQRLELWPKQDAKAHMDFLKRFNQELIDAGEFVRTEGLGGPEQMRIVRATKNGAAAITDGPFPESKEVLAGYWVIDVETPQRAYELAARASAAPGVGGKPLDQRDGFAGRELPMQVDHQLGVRPKRFAQRGSDRPPTARALSSSSSPKVATIVFSS